jgi:ABC-type Fe3+-hydroxamate transport system substrate-binding protein
MRFSRTIVALTASAFLSLGLQATTASAGVIGTQDYLSATDRAGQIASVQASLSRADVRAQLEGYGVNASDAAARVASLTDQELTEVAQKMDSLPAGGDGVLVVVGIVFIVLLILELTGVIDIFKRV